MKAFSNGDFISRSSDILNVITVPIFFLNRKIIIPDDESQCPLGNPREIWNNQRVS